MMTPLKLGSKGVLVRELQGLLNDGRSPRERLRPDGHFGKATDQAVRAYQKSMNLKPDGIVGPTTWSRLHGIPAGRAMARGHDPFDPIALATWLAALVQPAKPGPAAAKPSSSAVAGPAVSPSVGTSNTDPAFPSAADKQRVQRIAFANYEGKSWVIPDFEKYVGWEVQLATKLVFRKHDSKNTEAIKNECAQFVQMWGIPQTKHWRRGPQVCRMKPGELKKGTVVATLRDGAYHSDYSGRSHVGIYMGHDPYDGPQSKGGVTLLDQFNGSPIARRTKLYNADADAKGGKSKKAWTDSAGVRQTHRVSWVKDGEEYFVLMTGD